MKRQGVLSLTGVLLLVLLALLTMHEWEQVVQGDPVTRQSAEKPPMLQLAGVQGLSFGASGEAELRLSATSMNWDEQNATSVLAGPDLVLPLVDGEWHIQARAGELEEQPGRLTLTGEVVADRSGPAPLKMETAALLYMMRSDRVSVPGPVVIRSAEGEIRAGAMEADLRGQVLTLSRGVETRYVPASR